MDYRFILATCIFITFDVVTGVLQAFINGTFDSKKMRQGGLHKICLLVTLAFGVALDYTQTLVELGFEFPCLKSIAGYITFMEILSCIENLNLAFPNLLPKSLVKILNHAAEENGVDAHEDHDQEG